MVLLALTGLIGAIRHREPARLLVNGALIGVLAVTFLVLLYPTLNYVRTYGTERAGRAAAQVTEQERYGLKISRMVLPDPRHRNDTLADVGRRAQENSPVPSEGGQALTILGTIGFLGLLYRLVTSGWGHQRGGQPLRAPPRARPELGARQRRAHHPAGDTARDDRRVRGRHQPRRASRRSGCGTASC